MKRLLPLAAALGALSGCGPPLQAPNVVVIVLDTVRADHLSCYGYERVTTPNLDALAALSERCANVHATAPWTLPSHASLFTGKFPHEHGADARKDADGTFHDAWPLSDDEWTLAEVLGSEGYETGAFVANAGYVTERNGLAQGFDEFISKRMTGDQVVDAALDWIDDQDRPFFAFLNLMDAHRKYNVAPLPDAAARRLPDPPQRDTGKLLDELCSGVLEHEEPPPPELVREAIDAYDLGLANADRALGRLFAALRERGVYEDTLIVVTADHGEYFGEHDLAEHSKDVYEPALRIPLIFHRPAQASGSVNPAALSIADAPRMVLECLPEPLRRFASRFPGSGPERGLLAELRFTRSKDMGAAYGARFDRERQVLYSGTWKLICSSDGHDELYELNSDPLERRNLIAEDPERSAKLRARLRGLTRNRRVFEGDAPPPALTREEQRILAETGYAAAQPEQR